MSKHFPQCILQMGPQRPRDGQGHTAHPKTSPLRCLEEAASEWGQRDGRMRPTPISLELQGKGSSSGAPSCHTPSPLHLGFYSWSGQSPSNLGAVGTRLRGQV